MMNIILVYPMFIFINANEFTIILFQVLFGIFIGCIQGVFIFTLGNIFPAHIRNRGIAITFTGASAFLGGTAPLICSYVLEQWHLISFPALYIIIFGLITLVLSWCL